MNQQLLRLAGVFTIVFGAFAGARHFLIPPTFGADGHYRAAAVGPIASRAVKFAGKSECADCHEEVTGAARRGNHRGVSCEVCHGPAAVHAESGGDSATVQKIQPRKFCVVCHAYDASRPTGFAQIDPVEHNPQKACTKCHDPHAPRPPRTPGECRACHGQIARAKGVSEHARLDCTSCHHVPEQHKLTPHAVAAAKPTDISACTNCHAQADEKKRGDASQIDVNEHYKRNLCWDCHYPHNPKAQ